MILNNLTFNKKSIKNQLVLLMLITSFDPSVPTIKKTDSILVL